MTRMAKAAVFPELDLYIGFQPQSIGDNITILIESGVRTPMAFSLREDIVEGATTYKLRMTISGQEDRAAFCRGMLFVIREIMAESGITENDENDDD